MGNSTSGSISSSTDVHSTVSIPTSPPAPQHVRGMKDARGIERGGCRKCPHCTEFITSDPQEGGQTSINLRCTRCDCPPGVHENLSAKQVCGGRTPVGMPTPLASTTPGFVPHVSIATPANGPLNQGSLCSYPGCSQQVEFDLNSGTEFACCSDHLHAAVPYNGSNTACVSFQQPPSYVDYIQPGGTAQPQFGMWTQLVEHYQKTQ